MRPHQGQIASSLGEGTPNHGRQPPNGSPMPEPPTGYVIQTNGRDAKLGSSHEGLDVGRFFAPSGLGPPKPYSGHFKRSRYILASPCVHTRTRAALGKRTNNIAFGYISTSFANTREGASRMPNRAANPRACPHGTRAGFCALQRLDPCPVAKANQCKMARAALG